MLCNRLMSHLHVVTREPVTVHVVQNVPTIVLKKKLLTNVAFSARCDKI